MFCKNVWSIVTLWHFGMRCWALAMSAYLGKTPTSITNNIMHLSRSFSSPFTDPTFSNVSLVESPRRCALGLSRTALFSSRAAQVVQIERTPLELCAFGKVVLIQAETVALMLMSCWSLLIGE